MQILYERNWGKRCSEYLLGWAQVLQQWDTIFSTKINKFYVLNAIIEKDSYKWKKKSLNKKFMSIYL